MCEQPPAEPAAPIRVLLADDQPMLLTALATILNACEGITVAATAENGAAALDRVRETRIDVAVLDIRMPVLDGIAAAERIRQTHPQVAILFLTTFNEPELVREALDAGAAGFLLKDAEPAELAAGIRAVRQGQARISEAAVAHVLDAYRQVRSTARSIDPAELELLRRLTPREFEVFGLVAAGMTNAEIAAHLIIGETTVKTHVSNLLLKLQCRDRVALVVCAGRLGLLDTPGTAGPPASS